MNASIVSRILVLAVFVLSACAPAAAPAQIVPVKIGWNKASAQAAGPVAHAKGFDKEFGIDITMVAFPSAPEAVQSTVTGATEASYGASVPTGPSLILEGAPIRSTQIYGYGGNRVGLVTMKNSGVETTKDLVGKTVATVVASDPEEFLILAVQKAGANPDQVKRVNMNYPDMPAALTTGQVQAVTLNEPTLSVFLAKEPNAKVLERAGPYVALAGSLYTSDKFRKAPDDVAYKTYLALAKAEQYIRKTGPDSDEISKIVADSTGVTQDNAKSAVKGVLFDPRIKPWTWTKHQEEMQFYVSIKKLTKVIGRDEYYDLGPQTRALKEHPELFNDLDAYLQANQATKEELNMTWPQ